MKHLKPIFSCCFAALALLSAWGCGLSGAQEPGVYYGRETDSPVPALIAAPVTPAPTATPRISSYDLNATLFRRDGVHAALTNVTYQRYRQVSVTVSISNQTNQSLSFDTAVPGSVNGWSVTFVPQEEGDAIFLDPQSALDITLYAPLDPSAAEWMALEDVFSLSLSFSGVLGEAAFAPASNAAQIPAPALEEAPEGGRDALLVHQNSQARFYYHYLDPVSAVLYISAERLNSPFSLTAIPRVNGYALGAQGQAAAFSADARLVMLAVPLLPTIQAYALNEMEDLCLSVVMTQNNKELGADSFSIPVTEEALASLRAAAQEGASTAGPDDAGQEPGALPQPAAPAYSGSGRTFYQGGDITIYYESAQTEPSDYYGRVTRCRMVCVNNTAGVLYPGAEVVRLAGAAMDGGFGGYIPPYSQTVFELLICANVNPGSGLYVELTLLDGSNRLRRVAREDISFTA